MNAADSGRADLVAWKEARPKNFFTSDGLLTSILETQLTGDFSKLFFQWKEAGALAAGVMNDLAIESNRDENLPRLESSGSLGEPVESVVFHPSYHRLGELIWNTGVLSLLTQHGNETASAAHAYLMAHNGEAGHLCPLACTAGAIKLIQTLGSAEQKTKYLPQLLEKNYAKRLHASQFLTEIQGGSDVGANTCSAVAVGNGKYRIYGEKWFCSVMDAGLFVVTARPDPSRSGTGGLGLFLVPRWMDGHVNGFHIRRLKSKIGTRSMATGETEFDGAFAEPIGPIEDGFKNAVSIVLDTSRLQNAVSACGILSRAAIEAKTFAAHRKAFGKPIAEYPLVQQTLRRLQTSAAAALATTFRVLYLTDNAQSEEQLAARRIHVMANKYWTSLRCTEGVHDAIEVMGGNGTIEDFSILPRLYRDAIVLESWEGTHNTLCLQILRDFIQREMHNAWINDVQSLIAGIRNANLASQRDRATAMLNHTQAIIHKMLESKENAELQIRDVVNRMCVTHAYAAMLHLADASSLGKEWKLHAENFSQSAQ